MSIDEYASIMIDEQSVGCWAEQGLWQSLLPIKILQSLFPHGQSSNHDNNEQLTLKMELIITLVKSFVQLLKYILLDIISSCPRSLIDHS